MYLQLVQSDVQQSIEIMIRPSWFLLILTFLIKITVVELLSFLFL